MHRPGGEGTQTPVPSFRGSKNVQRAESDPLGQPEEAQTSWSLSGLQEQAGCEALDHGGLSVRQSCMSSSGGTVVWKGVTLGVGAVRGPPASRGRDAGVVVNDASRGAWR